MLDGSPAPCSAWCLPRVTGTGKQSLRGSERAGNAAGACEQFEVLGTLMLLFLLKPMMLPKGLTFLTSKTIVLHKRGLC